MRALALAALLLGGCTTVGLETDQHELVFFGDPGTARVLETSQLPNVDLDVTGDAAAKQVSAHIGVTVWKRSGKAYFDQTQGLFTPIGDSLVFSLANPDQSEQTTVDGLTLVAPASFGLRVSHHARVVTARGLLGPVEIDAHTVSVEDVGPVALTASTVTGRLGRGGRIVASAGAYLVVTGRDFESLTVESGGDVSIELPPGLGYDLDLQVAQQGSIHVVAGANDVIFGTGTQEYHPRLQVSTGGPRIVVTAHNGTVIIKDFPGPLPIPTRS